MSGSATPERDVQLLDIGKQCSDPTCLLVDFLPFKCQHCARPFCGEHFLPTAHHCAEYDAAKLDRIAPACPLCNTPVAIPPGQDPNVRMERHFNSECSVMTGRSGKASTTPHCARPKCGKVLFSPIRCDSCKQQFCPQHRFPKDHSCSTAQASGTRQQAGVNNAWANVQNQTSAASAAALAAIKRAAAAAPTATRTHSPAKPQPPSLNVKQASSSSSSRSNPFSATDRQSILLTTTTTTTITPPSRSINPSASTSDDNDDSHDPPERCSPKPNPSTNGSILSFVPPPLFGVA